MCTCRSPHLLEVRERIRINGRPLSKIKFATYFWRVFEKLNNSKHSYKMLMPGYFGFLTVMAFNVFLKEKVMKWWLCAVLPTTDTVDTDLPNVLCIELDC